MRGRESWWMMRLPHACTQRPQYVPSPPLSPQPYPDSPPGSLPPSCNAPSYKPTPPASPSGQKHPILPLSLGAAQVMQNSREEHAECELIGLGFEIGARRLRRSHCGLLCLPFVLLHSRGLQKKKKTQAVEEVQMNEFKSSYGTQFVKTIQKQSQLRVDAIFQKITHLAVIFAQCSHYH